MFLLSLFDTGQGCDLWWFICKSKFFHWLEIGLCVCVCVLGPDVLQLICVCGCVTEQWGFLTEGKIEGKKRERKRQTQRNSLMREERFHIWTHWTSLPAQLQNHLKFFFPSFFVHWCVSAYDNVFRGCMANALTWSLLFLPIRLSYPGIDLCVWMSQSSLVQLFEVDQSALMGGSRQLRWILFSAFVHRNLLYQILGA